MIQCFPVEGLNFLAQIKEIGSDSEGQQVANSRLEVSPAASRVVGGRMLMQTAFGVVGADQMCKFAFVFCLPRHFENLENPHKQNHKFHSQQTPKLYVLLTSRISGHAQVLW